MFGTVDDIMKRCFNEYNTEELSNHVLQRWALEEAQRTPKIKRLFNDHENDRVKAGYVAHEDIMQSDGTNFVTSHITNELGSEQLLKTVYVSDKMRLESWGQETVDGRFIFSRPKNSRMVSKEAKARAPVHQSSLLDASFHRNFDEKHMTMETIVNTIRILNELKNIADNTNKMDTDAIGIDTLFSTLHGKHTSPDMIEPLVASLTNGVFRGKPPAYDSNLLYEIIASSPKGSSVGDYTLDGLKTLVFEGIVAYQNASGSSRDSMRKGFQLLGGLKEFRNDVASQAPLALSTNGVQLDLFCLGKGNAYRAIADRTDVGGGGAPSHSVRAIFPKDMLDEVDAGERITEILGGQRYSQCDINRRLRCYLVASHTPRTGYKLKIAFSYQPAAGVLTQQLAAGKSEMQMSTAMGSESMHNEALVLYLFSVSESQKTIYSIPNIESICVENIYIDMYDSTQGWLHDFGNVLTWYNASTDHAPRVDVDYALNAVVVSLAASLLREHIHNKLYTTRHENRNALLNEDNMKLDMQKLAMFELFLREGKTMRSAYIVPPFVKADLRKMTDNVPRDQDVARIIEMQEKKLSALQARKKKEEEAQEGEKKTVEEAAEEATSDGGE